MQKQIRKLKQSNENGITLVALVVTIIVLLILAGVSISLVLGNNGVITKASTAVTENRKATVQEDIAMAWASCETDYLNEWTKNTSLVKSEYLSPDTIANKFNNQYLTGGQASNISREEDGSITGTYTSDDNNTNVDFIIESNGVVTITGEATLSPTIAELKEQYKDTDNTFSEKITITQKSDDGTKKQVTLPEGYHFAVDSGNTIDEGIVIVDSHDNEWVWVPVPTPSDLYAATTGDAKLFDGTTPYTKYSKSEIVGDITRNKPGDTSGDRVPREPDVLSSTSYDTTERLKTAGYNSAADIVTEYDTMIDSIEQYKGFYVGRYELNGTTTNPTVKKGGTVMGKTSWYDLAKACKSFSEESTTSGMIWGCQWDAMLDWIANYGDQKDITDSREWGNYSDSIGAAANNSGSKRTSGYNEAWKANNIYDVAGNAWEWTMEACGTFARANRGGHAGQRWSV